MKKVFKLSIAFCFALIIQSCDFVSNPVETTSANSTDTSTTTYTRKVLVEDYTGHLCPNCPQAGVTANQLITTFGDKVVIMAVHAGIFAKPSPPAALPSGAPAGSYAADYRTTYGTECNSSTYFNLPSYPNGMVNRKDYPTSHIKAHGSWSSEVANLLALPPDANIKITKTYNSTTRNLSLTIDTKFLTNNYPSGDYNLTVLLTQDSIIDWQLDGTVSIPDYVHRHMLRDAINSPWGDNLVSGAITPDAVISKTYNYTIPAAYNGIVCDANHCHVVAFLYATSNYEIVQVEEAKITP